MILKNHKTTLPEEAGRVVFLVSCVLYGRILIGGQQALLGCNLLKIEYTL